MLCLAFLSTSSAGWAQSTWQGGTNLLHTDPEETQVGIGTTTPLARFHVQRGSILVTQNSLLANPPANCETPALQPDQGVLFFSPCSVAFRAGRHVGNEWTGTNLGGLSFAFGNDVWATNNGTFTVGLNARALSPFSMVIGTGAGEDFRLENTTPHSLMIGYNSYRPSVFVGSGNGLDGPGRVALGHAEPLTQNHFRGSLMVDGFGDPSYGEDLPTGGGARMMYAPYKSAFRVGTLGLFTDHWDEPNIGFNSFAAGVDVRASGNTAISMGTNNAVAADQAIALGNSNQLNANSTQTIALGARNVTNGANNRILAKSTTIVNGENNTVLGDSNTVRGNSNVVIGNQIDQAADNSYLFGYDVSSNSGGMLLGSFLRSIGTNLLLGTGLSDVNNPPTYCYNGVPLSVGIATGQSSPTVLVHQNRMSLNMGNTLVTGANFYVNGNAAIGYMNSAIAPPANGLFVRGVTAIGATSNSINPDFQLNVLGSPEAVNPLLVQGGSDAPFLIWGRSTAGANGFNPNHKMLELERFEDGVAFRVYASGRTEVGENLKVEGTIQAGGIMCAQQVRVSLTPDCVPDYVFDPGYQLMPLDEVEAYVHTHRHLPGVPSVQELTHDGTLELSELLLKTLEKVEEQTLYILQLQKRVQELEQSR